MKIYAHYISNVKRLIININENKLKKKQSIHILEGNFHTLNELRLDREELLRRKKK